MMFLAMMAWTSCRTPPPMQNRNIPMPPLARTNQLDTNEAMAMIEFCVDLDNEDDRGISPHSSVYNMREDRCTNWARSLDSREIFSRNNQIPKENGFPFFDSAWTFWTNKANKTGGTNTYVLAFRGTVFGNDHSVEEDALATTVAAQYGLELPLHKFLPITFGSLPFAEVHEGFAYAVFGMLFDKKYGVLANVLDKIEPNATLIITGHSQGAALATLAHAFFFYAGQEDRFTISSKNLTLKSYVFAQPKPGNYQFMQDFARITGGGATSFTFNNTLDPVPMMPPTHYFFAESFDGDSSKKNYIKVFRFINNSANYVRRDFSALVGNKLARKIKQTQHRETNWFCFAKELKEGSTNRTAGGVSQGFAWAGDLIPLVGHYDGGDYYHNPVRDGNDPWIQHHATTYRRLLEDLFGYEATLDPVPAH
jgi:hypothetical protein